MTYIVSSGALNSTHSLGGGEHGPSSLQTLVVCKFAILFRHSNLLFELCVLLFYLYCSFRVVSG